MKPCDHPVLYFPAGGRSIAEQNTTVKAYPDHNQYVHVSLHNGLAEVQRRLRVCYVAGYTRNGTIPGKTDVRSISLFGLSVVTVNFGMISLSFYACNNTLQPYAQCKSAWCRRGVKDTPYGATGEIFRC